MEKPTQEQTKQKLAIGYAINSFFTNFNLTSDTSQEKLQEVYDDLDVRSAINTIVKEIQGRKANVKSRSNNENLATDILARYNKVDKNILIDNILKSKWFKYSVTEILWGDNYTVSGIKRQLNENFDLRLDNGKYVWYETYSSTPVPWYKAIISVNDPDDNNPYGQTELLPLLKLFEIKSNILSAVNSIVKKYGGVITWFTYNADSTSEDQLEEMIAGAEGIGDETVIPIPTRANGSQGYGKDFGFVPLSDLTTDVHMSLEAWIEKSITKYFLGGTLTQDVGSSGSYAASQTHQEIREDIISGYLNYTLQEMQKLIEIDSVFYGYNPDDFYWTLENAADESALVKLNQEKANVIDTVSKNYDIAPEYVSEVLGIPIQYITKKEVNTGIAFSNMKEFAKTTAEQKKSLEKKQNDYFFTSIEKKKTEVTNKLSAAMIDAVKSIKKIEDITKININMPKEFWEFMKISDLQGRVDIIDSSNLSYKEFAELYTNELFNVPYDEAIKSIQNKYPILYDDLDDIDKDISDRFFWVKESTTLELTKKIQDSIINQLKNGGTMKEWISEVDSYFDKWGITPNGSYTETVYRTNLQTLYSAGRYKQQEEQKENFPYWQYVAIMDDVTTDICSQLNDKVFRYDDPIWNNIYPPLHWNCFEKETEVFTNEGWKKFYNLNMNEKFASINPKTKKLEYVKANKKIEYIHKGKMIRLKSSNFELIATPDHQQCYVSKWHKDKNKDDELRFRDIESMAVSDTIPRTVLFEGKKIEKYSVAGIEFNALDFMQFLGWYLGDGSITLKSENYWQLKISQEKDEKKIEEIHELMLKLFEGKFKVHKWTGGIFISGNNKEFYEWFKKLGYSYEKYIPEDIKELDVSLLKSILTGLSKTDATIYDNANNNLGDYNFKPNIVYFSSSLKLINDIGELIFKTGKLASYDFKRRNQGKEIEFKNGKYEIKHDCYKVFELNTKNYSHKKKYMQEIEYNDMVYCVELEKNHTLFVRYNGKTTWSGNCRSSVIAYNQDDINTEGLSISAGEQEEGTDAYKKLTKSTFKGNPAKDAEKNFDELIKNKSQQVKENQKEIEKLVK